VLVLSEGRLTATQQVAEQETFDDDDLLIHVGGDVAAFLAALRDRGLHAVADHEEPDRLTVRGSSRTILDAIRDAAVEAGVGLRELRPATRTLEQVVLEAME
jgi:hypothetical protein